MPYIVKSDRPEINEQVEKVLKIISTQDDLIRVMEYVALYCHDVVRGYMENLTTPHNEFNCMSFERKAKFDVHNAAMEVVKHLTRPGTDLLKQSGELNYSLTAVVWGAMGEDSRFTEAKYGQRAYLKGAISRIRDNFLKGGKNDERKYYVVHGILSDVIDETYRRYTAKYEDKKMEENGDVYPID